MFILGLTGGIACGKSTASRWLQRQGAAVVDADAVAHSLMVPGGSLYAAYVKHWGEAILQPEGTLDRHAIGRRVFGDKAAEQWLNATAHPLIREAIMVEVERLRAAGTRVCVLDVPLLYESGWDALCDKVCVLWLRPEVQRARLTARNGYSEAEATARIAAQMPLAEKCARANYVIDNNGSRRATARQLATMWEEIQHDANA